MCFTPNSFICWTELQRGKAADLLPALHGYHAVFGIHRPQCGPPEGFHQLFHEFRRSTARVPMMQRVMPRSSIFFTASALRMPPPSSIGTETLDTMARMASPPHSRNGPPVRRPDPQIWRKDAPGSPRALPYQPVYRSILLRCQIIPCVRRTHLPPFMSIAGYNCIVIVLLPTERLSWIVRP